MTVFGGLYSSTTRGGSDFYKPIRSTHEDSEIWLIMSFIVLPTDFSKECRGLNPRDGFWTVTERRSQKVILIHCSKVFWKRFLLFWSSVHTQMEVCIYILSFVHLWTIKNGSSFSLLKYFLKRLKSKGYCKKYHWFFLTCGQQKWNISKAISKPVHCVWKIDYIV